MATRIKTKFTGVYYRQSTTNGKDDKTYYITYKDENNKTRELKIGKYSEGIRENYCNTKRNEIITKQRLGEEPPAIAKLKRKNKTTFEYIANLYFDNLTSKESIVKDLRGRYKKHIELLIGAKDIYEITSKDIEPLKQIDLSDTSRNYLIGLINTIYNFAIERELFNGISPTKKVKLFKIDNDRERYLTKKDIKLLLNELKENELLEIFVRLSLATGGRLETILNIHSKDIDLEHNSITLKDFKNNTTYKGFFGNKLKELISNKKNCYIVSLDGSKLTKRQLQCRLMPILNRLFNENIDKSDTKNRVVIHTLRHTFASLLAIQGTPIFTIQKLMNHKDIKQTLRYAKLSPDNGKDEVLKLEF